MFSRLFDASRAIVSVRCRSDSDNGQILTTVYWESVVIEQGHRLETWTIMPWFKYT